MSRNHNTKEIPSQHTLIIEGFDFTFLNPKQIKWSKLNKDLEV